MSSEAACAQPPAQPFKGQYQEPYRPQFHFTPEQNWINDPNGLVFYKGEYHLFFQYNPEGNGWGHMSWGHAVSRDLVHWKPFPAALPEQKEFMVFSGSAVVDLHNTSGFGKNGEPPMVAIYTAHHTDKLLQNQHLAFSLDRGRTWTFYTGNPVLDLGQKDFRDPKVFWHEETHRWIMVVSKSTVRKIGFYASPDLKHWTPLSDFGPAGSTEGIWECPDLFPLTAGEGKTREKKWVLVVNVGSGAPAGGSGGQYFVGGFNGTHFVPESAFEKTAHWLDFGPDYYAAVSWSDAPAGEAHRRMIGWMSNWQYAGEVPTSPWRGAMSVPREVRLEHTPAGVRLKQKPVHELRKLRGKEHRFSGGTMAEVNAWIAEEGLTSTPSEWKFVLSPALEGQTGIKLFIGEEEETLLGISPKEGHIFVDRIKGRKIGFSPSFSRMASAPLAFLTQPISLHLLVDACSVEVFVNDGETVLTALTFPSPLSRGVQFFGGDSASISTLSVWPLTSIWKGAQ